jgi:hypothetical protein
VSDNLLWSIEHLLVDAPTESGNWCIVSEHGICAPTDVEVSTWTEIVDQFGDRVDEDDPAAVAEGHEVTRVSIRRYDPGREESYDLPQGRRWIRWETLLEVFAKQADDVSRISGLLARHQQSGPLSWEDVGWDSSTPDVVRIGLREEGGALRTALIPVAKAALVGAAAAMATTSKPIRRAKTGKVAESLQTTQRKVSR